MGKDDTSDNMQSNKKMGEAKVIVKKIDPSTLLPPTEDAESATKPKVNTVYVVPSNASKKAVLKRIKGNLDAEIIDASALYDSSILGGKNSSRKIIKVPPLKQNKGIKFISYSVNNQEKISNKHKERKYLIEPSQPTIETTIHTTNSEGYSIIEQEEIEETVTQELNEEGQEFVTINPELDRDESSTNHDLSEHQQSFESAEPSFTQSYIDLQSRQGNWSGVNIKRSQDPEEQLRLAIQDVLESNMSIKRAAHVYGIRYSVLMSKLNRQGSSSKSALGADPALTEKEEVCLVDWIKNRYKSGCPVKKIDLINRVAEIVSDGRPTRFKDGIPGEKWFTNFMSRNPKVSTLGPSARSDTREIPSKRSIMSWFKRCEEHLQAFGQEHLLQDNRRIGSIEELTLCLISSKTKLSNGSSSNVFYLPEERSGNIMVLIGACADGFLTPPMPVFSCRKPPPALINSIPSGWGIGLSKDGNINREVLHSYFKNILIPWLTEQNRLPFILFIDKLRSYLSVDIADFCAHKGLLIYNFYPNSCYVLQPLYKSVIDTIKRSWSSLSLHRNDKEALLQFCPTLNQMLYDLSPPYIVVESFKACGIYPFDPKAPDYNKCLLISYGVESKNFNSAEYATALDVLEDTIGKVKSEVFRATIKGIKLLKSEDAPLYKVWHKLVSKVDVTRNQNSELQEYKHEKIIRGAYRKLPRPETYLMVVDEDNDDLCADDDGLYGFSNDIVASSSNAGTEAIDSQMDVSMGSNPAVINLFPKTDEIMDESEITKYALEDEEEEEGEENNSQSQCLTADFWKDHYITEEKSNSKDNSKIKEARKQERRMRKQRKLDEMSELDKNIRKKMKKVLRPRVCSHCFGESGKLIKCMVCKKFIHFDCMMEEEQQIMSDLYDDNVAFDYICPSCSS